MKRLMKPDGLKLHLLRTSKELSVKAVATQTELCRRSISQVEQGVEVSTLTANKIANAYNVNVFDYFELIEK